MPSIRSSKAVDKTIQSRTSRLPCPHGDVVSNTAPTPRVEDSEIAADMRYFRANGVLPAMNQTQAVENATLRATLAGRNPPANAENLRDAEAEPNVAPSCPGQSPPGPPAQPGDRPGSASRQRWGLGHHLDVTSEERDVDWKWVNIQLFGNAVDFSHGSIAIALCTFGVQKTRQKACPIFAAGAALGSAMIRTAASLKDDDTMVVSLLLAACFVWCSAILCHSRRRIFIKFKMNWENVVAACGYRDIASAKVALYHLVAAEDPNAG
ncbi:hypothetical protein PG984_011329 [Apiospora sp. TS-2023a]